MSLDETASKVWQLKRPPLAILVAAKANEMVCAQHPEEVQAPFLSLSKRLLEWWPNRQPEPTAIYENEFSACLELFNATEPSAPLKPMLTGAYLQMAGLLRVAPRSLPSDGYYDLDESDFQGWLREAAKAGRLPVAQFEKRLKYLLENSKERWPKLVVRADRMRWSRGAPWTKLDKRVRDLASLADLGATVSWTKVGDLNELRLELEGIKRIAPLSPEELAALRRVIPEIAEPE